MCGSTSLHSICSRIMEAYSYANEEFKAKTPRQVAPYSPTECVMVTIHNILLEKSEAWTSGTCRFHVQTIRFLFIVAWLKIRGKKLMTENLSRIRNMQVSKLSFISKIK